MDVNEIKILITVLSNLLFSNPNFEKEHISKQELEEIMKKIKSLKGTKYKPIFKSYEAILPSVKKTVLEVCSKIALITKKNGNSKESGLITNVLFGYNPEEINTKIINKIYDEREFHTRGGMFLRALQILYTIYMIGDEFVFEILKDTTTEEFNLSCNKNINLFENLDNCVHVKFKDIPTKLDELIDQGERNPDILELAKWPGKYFVELNLTSLVKANRKSARQVELNIDMIRAGLFGNFKEITILCNSTTYKIIFPYLKAVSGYKKFGIQAKRPVC